MHTTKVQTTACSTQGWPCWAQQKGHQYSHRLMNEPGRAAACVLGKGRPTVEVSSLSLDV